jgi:hypothetical protein
MSDWSAFGLFGKYRMRQFQQYLGKGKQRSGRHSNPVSKMCQNGHKISQESIWESGRKVEDGAGDDGVMECEMCTEHDKEGKG